MIKKVTVQLTTFEVAVINQALDYYKKKVVEIAEFSEDNGKGLEDYCYRMKWLKANTGYIQAKVTNTISSEQLTLSQYLPS